MADAAQLLLVRHCSATGQDADAPLTAEGRTQALQLADWLAAHAVDHVVSSPYLRARETIAPFAHRLGLRVHVDDRLMEHRLASPPIEAWREAIAASFTDPEHRVPGGESASETLTRAWGALESTLDAGHRLPLLVSHGQWLSLVLHSIDPRFGFDGWQSLSNPDVFLLEATGAARYRFERLWRSPHS